MSDIFDDMMLPNTNSNEELEDLSNNAFIPLFDVKLFAPRKEPGRDKGVDFRIELKKNGKFTGFQFLIQLKSTETLKKNTDGSISLSLTGANINYLLNFGIPAYYVLYYIPEKNFFYENLNDFVKALSEQKTDWQKQGNHILRFEKELTQDAIMDMYQAAYNRGKFFRQINEKLALRSSLVPDKILVDDDVQVSTDSEIRQLIEKIGLHLINEAAWTKIIETHKKASQTIASTAKYNLIVGIAYYYSGELLRALDFLKTATRLKNELQSDLQEHLSLFELTVRFALGIINKIQYDEKAQLLQSSNHLKYYIKTDQEKEKYLHAKDEDIEAHYEAYIQEMSKILASADANENIKLFIRCDMVLLEGSKINMDSVRFRHQIRAAASVFGVNQQLWSSMTKDIMQRKFSWAQKSDALKDEAINSENAFVLYLVVYNEVKVLYEFEAFAVFFHFDQANAIHAINNERIQFIRKEILRLDETIEYFRQVAHIGNLCACLALKYEMSHFINDIKTAETIAEHLSGIIETYELTEFRQKLDALRNRGTTHEKLSAFVENMSDQARRRQEEYNHLVADMKSMDQQDEARMIHKNSDFIDLYPIGAFSFPKTERTTAYEILKISAPVRATFDHLLDVDKVVPIVNLYNNPIDHEGIDGVTHSTKIEDWRVIHGIRKAFFEKGFVKYVKK